MALEFDKRLTEAKSDPRELLTLFDAIEKQHSSLPRDEKSALVSKLLDLIREASWDENVSLRSMEILKLLGRDPTGCESLYSQQGVTTLVEQCRFDNGVDTVMAKEALKCLSNCLSLDDKIERWIEEHDVSVKCCKLLGDSQQGLVTQFLGCRILFFMSVQRPRSGERSWTHAQMLSRLLNNDVCTTLQNILTQQTGSLIKNSTDGDSVFHPSSVLSEALKLHFSLMKQCQETTNIPGHPEAKLDFKNCLDPIIDFVLHVPFPDPQPLQPPHSHAIHSLMLYKSSDMIACWKRHETTWADTSEASVTDTLLQVLDQSLRHIIPDKDQQQQSPSSSQTSADVDATLVPLLLVLKSMADVPRLKDLLATRLLPQESDRETPVHQGNSLSAYMVRLMTVVPYMNTRYTAGELLFTLCDNESSSFIEHIGYGNAAGFLVNKGIPVEMPKGYDLAADGHEGKAINPITGQFISTEQYDGPRLSDMTDEEKEREAERLFVLFERLRKNGVINVENPVVTAMREQGEKFAELDLSDHDDQ